MAGGPLGDLGSAVSDIFGAIGSSDAASAYGTASNIATKNAALTEISGQIQQQQEGIAITKALGGEQASTSGAGFNNSGGTPTDLLRASVQQGALSKQLISNQTQITALGYEQQAAAYKGQEKAANTAAAGQGLGGILGIASSVIGWVICTELLKQRRMPVRWYNFGAQVFRHYPNAVKEGYHVWAVPSVRHLRVHPYSLYSCFLCVIFNWRAENIAAHAGVEGARKLWRGALVTVVLWPICYSVGWVRITLRKHTDWERLYNAR